MSSMSDINHPTFSPSNPSLPLQPWQHFKRPFVRDLAFSLACPNALNHWLDLNPLTPTPDVTIHSAQFWQAQFEAYAHRLHELDNTPYYQDLTRYLMNRPSPYRLGFHFEGLIHFWLEDGFALGLHPFEVIAHNVQLYRDKQTVGELDFIIRNHETGEVEHWELSIKFYLGSALFEPVNWVGINAKDTLHRKLTHMQTKQFKTVWVDMDFYDKVKIDKRYAVLKGRFFLPLKEETITAPTLPNWLANDFPIHHWLDLTGKTSDEIQHIIQDAQIRHAHYVEWFTRRPFYDADAIAVDKLSIQIPLNELNTGLYFIDDSPVVLVNRR